MFGPISAWSHALAVRRLFLAGLGAHDFTSGARFRLRRKSLLKTLSCAVPRNGLRTISHNLTFRSRKAFPMTETELRLIAPPAMIGLRSTPKYG
jgi:hypothetical protein